jgi:hypothetical protein
MDTAVIPYNPDTNDTSGYFSSPDRAVSHTHPSNFLLPSHQTTFDCLSTLYGDEMQGNANVG